MRVFVFLFFTTFFISVNAQDVVGTYTSEDIKEVQEKGNVLLFENKTINLGKILRNSKHEFEFRFLNISKEVIQYDFFDVCSCSEVIYDEEEEILPGKEGVIKVIFDSSKKKDVEEPITIDMQIKNVEKKTNLPFYYTLTYFYSYKD